MKRLLFLLCLGGLALPGVSQAQSGTYYMIGIVEQGAWFADRDSVRWAGGNPTITLHLIYRTPQVLERDYGSGYDFFQRAEFRMEHDCAGRRSRDVGFSMHGFSAVTRPVRLTEQVSWKAIEDEGIFSELFELVCNNSVPPDTMPATDLQLVIAAYYRTMNSPDD